MGDLLAGSPVRPHPPDIEMGMSADSDLRAVGSRDKSGVYSRPPIYRGIFLEQILISSLGRASETFTLPALAEIEHVIGRIETRQ